MSIAISDLLSEGRCITDVPATSKKKLLEQLAEIVSEAVPDGTQDAIFDSLLAREKLGSTGIGEGVAIPHCRLPQCHQAIGVLFRLSEAIDFDAIDKQPVDLVFALLVPQEATDEHLQVLATLAKNFNEASFRDGLRAATSDQEFYQQAIKAC
jgi:PTS system nitrogen regulatory IIA component